MNTNPFPELPQPCPICGSKVYLVAVPCYETESGKALEIEYECVTEPEIDSDDWEEWHRGHYKMPYVDWLPWEISTMEWLNNNYRYDGESLIKRVE